MAGHLRFSQEELKASTEPQHQPLSQFQPQLDINQGQGLDSCIQNFLAIGEGMAQQIQHQQKQISVFPLNQRHQQGEDDWQLMQKSQAGLKSKTVLASVHNGLPVGHRTDINVGYSLTIQMDMSHTHKSTGDDPNLFDQSVLFNSQNSSKICVDQLGLHLLVHNIWNNQ